MIGTTGERSVRTSGARTSDERAHETDGLRPPERQRGLLSFLTWPVLLAQASVAEAAFGERATSLHPEEEQSDAAAARFDARDPASADDQLPGALAGSIGRDELTGALEGPASPGFEEDFARVDGPEADGGEHAASLALRSADAPEAQGGGGGGGGSSSSRSSDPRSASTEAHAPGDNAHPAAPAAAIAHGPTVSFVDAVQPGDTVQGLLQAVHPAHASVGETLTGVVDAGLGTVAAVGQSVLPVVTDVAGAAADLVDVALQPVGSALDIVAPVVDSVAPIVAGVAGVATDVVDVALQPIGSTLEIVQPVVTELAATVTDIAEPVVDVIPPVIKSVPPTIMDLAGISAEDIATVVEGAPPIVAGIADAATDAGEPLVTPTLDTLQSIGGDSPSSDSLDAGSIGTLGGALASGGVIVIDDGAPPAERASAGDGRYTDFDLALRDLTLGGRPTKPADGRTNDDTLDAADAPPGSRDEANDKANDGTSEAAGTPPPGEQKIGDDVGTAGGSTHSVDEVALRADDHLL